MAHVPQDILDRIARLEREVRQLAGRSQIRPAMNEIQHGEVIIGEGGRLIVRDPDGTPIFSTGQSEEGDWYVALSREDGAAAIQIGNNTFDGDEVRQMVRTFNRAGDVIMMDDYYADGFLGRPYVPIPMQAGHNVTGTSWQTTHLAKVWCQHAVLVAYWSVYTGAGSADARLMIDDGSGMRQLGDTITSTSGKEEFATIRLTPSEHGLKYGETATLLLQGRTSGSNTGTVWARGVWGDNTSTPDEAN